MLEINKYLTRPLACNSIVTPVHLFVTKHDHHVLHTPIQKHFITAKINPGPHVLMASSNELLSKYICMQADSEVEVQPITVAKHLSEVLGMSLVILDNHYCDITTHEMKWELHFYQPNPSTRAAMARQLLSR